jgi:2-oxoglutarate dehydrogenase E2 component (dihydrolipoamide succinyltransferase)
MNESMTITLPVGALEGTAAVLSIWLVEEGDKVRKGDPILELETDKVSMEVCAENDGSIERILAASGDNVNERTILGYLNCAAQPILEESPPLAFNGSSQNESVANISKCDVTNDGSKCHLIGPAVRKLLRKYDLNVTSIKGTGKGGRVTRDDILAYINTGADKEKNSSDASSTL